MEAISDFMEQFDANLEVIWGISTDDSLGGKVKITLLATGFGMDSIPGMKDAEDLMRLLQDEEDEAAAEKRREEEEEASRIEQMIEAYYGKDAIKPSQQFSFGKAKPYIFTEDDYLNDTVIDVVENSPVFQREPNFDPHSKQQAKPQSGGLFD